MEKKKNTVKEIQGTESNRSSQKDDIKEAIIASLNVIDPKLLTPLYLIIRKLLLSD